MPGGCIRGSRGKELVPQQSCYHHKGDAAAGVPHEGCPDFPYDGTDSDRAWCAWHWLLALEVVMEVSAAMLMLVLCPLPNGLVTGSSGPTTKMWFHTDLTLYPWYDREAHALAYGLPSSPHFTKSKDDLQEFPPSLHRVGSKVPPPPVTNAAGTRTVMPLAVHWSKENAELLRDALPGSASIGDIRLVFRKWQLEKLCKDKHHSAVPQVCRGSALHSFGIRLVQLPFTGFYACHHSNTTYG